MDAENNGRTLPAQRGSLSAACENFQTLLDSSRFRRALKQINDLARDGYKSAGENDNALLLWAYLAVQRRRPARREDWERCWARYTGKSWKALTEFPGRIRRIAEEVEGLGRSHFFDANRAVKAAQGLAVFGIGPGDHFQSDLRLSIEVNRDSSILLATLRNYANWLEVRVNHVSARMKLVYRQAPRNQSPFVPHVSDQVKLITGRFCDSEVAELLNAADLVVNGGHGNPEQGFDAQTVALLRSRQKRRARKT